MPVVGFSIVYLAWGHHEGIGEFFHTVYAQPDTCGKVMTLSLLANLAPFLYFNYKRLDHALRGIVSITVLYAVVVVLLKYNFFR